MTYWFAVHQNGHQELVDDAGAANLRADPTITLTPAPDGAVTQDPSTGGLVIDIAAIQQQQAFANSITAANALRQLEQNRITAYGEQTQRLGVGIPLLGQSKNYGLLANLTAGDPRAPYLSVPARLARMAGPSPVSPDYADLKTYGVKDVSDYVSKAAGEQTSAEKVSAGAKPSPSGVTKAAQEPAQQAAAPPTGARSIEPSSGILSNAPVGNPDPHNPGGLTAPIGSVAPHPPMFSTAQQNAANAVAATGQVVAGGPTATGSGGGGGHDTSDIPWKREWHADIAAQGFGHGSAAREAADAAIGMSGVEAAKRVKHGENPYANVHAAGGGTFGGTTMAKPTMFGGPPSGAPALPTGNDPTAATGFDPHDPNQPPQTMQEIAQILSSPPSPSPSPLEAAIRECWTLGPDGQPQYTGTAAGGPPGGPPLAPPTDIPSPLGDPLSGPNDPLGGPSPETALPPPPAKGKGGKPSMFSAMAEGGTSGADRRTAPQPGYDPKWGYVAPGSTVPQGANYYAQQPSVGAAGPDPSFTGKTAYPSTSVGAGAAPATARVPQPRATGGPATTRPVAAAASSVDPMLMQKAARWWAAQHGGTTADGMLALQQPANAAYRESALGMARAGEIDAILGAERPPSAVAPTSLPNQSLGAGDMRNWVPGITDSAWAQQALRTPGNPAPGGYAQALDAVQQSTGVDPRRAGVPTGANPNPTGRSGASVVGGDNSAVSEADMQRIRGLASGMTHRQLIDYIQGLLASKGGASAAGGGTYPAAGNYGIAAPAQTPTVPLPIDYGPYANATPAPGSAFFDPSMRLDPSQVEYISTTPTPLPSPSPYRMADGGTTFVARRPTMFSIGGHPFLVGEGVHDGRPGADELVSITDQNGQPVVHVDPLQRRGTGVPAAVAATADLAVPGSPYHYKAGLPASSVHPGQATYYDNPLGVNPTPYRPIAPTPRVGGYSGPMIPGMEPYTPDEIHTLPNLNRNAAGGTTAPQTIPIGNGMVLVRMPNGSYAVMSDPSAQHMALGGTVAPAYGVPISSGAKITRPGTPPGTTGQVRVPSGTGNGMTTVPFYMAAPIPRPESALSRDVAQMSQQDWQTLGLYTQPRLGFDESQWASLQARGNLAGQSPPPLGSYSRPF